MRDFEDSGALELEQIVLGALIGNPDRLDTWSIRGDYFAEPIHWDIFQLIESRRADGHDVSPAILANLLKAEPPITSGCDVPEYIRRLHLAGMDATPGIDQDLRLAAARRLVASVGVDLQDLGRNPMLNFADGLNAAHGALSEALSMGSQEPAQEDFEDVCRAVLDDVQNGITRDCVDLGYASLNSTFAGGIERGEFAILAARPSMGKSMVGGSIALQSARKGAGVMVFSLEMTRKQMMTRAISDLSYGGNRGIEYQRIMNNDLSENERRLVAEAGARNLKIPMRIDDRRGLTVADLRTRAVKFRDDLNKQGRNLDLIVVDHLGCLKPSGRYAGNRVHEVGEISDGLATLAKSLNVAVIALHQLNRGVEGRDNKRPGLSDLRDSGNLEQDASVVMFVYREAYYLSRLKFDEGSEQEMNRQALLQAKTNELEILVAKNRNGPTHTVHMFCDPGCNVVRDLAK